MRTTSLAPTARLAPWVRSYAVVETDDDATTRTLVPDSGIIVGFRYRGHAVQEELALPTRSPDFAVVGLRATARRMYTSPNAGIIVASFRPGGASQFFSEPLHELFGKSVNLAELVPRGDIDRVASKLEEAASTAERIAVVESFLVDRLRERARDMVVAHAIRAIDATRGSSRIGDLARELGVARDTLEKRFRRVVGAAPKQLATILRLRRAVEAYRPGTTLARLSVDAGYFDQSHFNRELRSVVGEAPQRFFHSRTYC